MCGANFLRSEGEQEAANWKKGVRYGSISVGMLSRGGGNGTHQQRRPAAAHHAAGLEQNHRTNEPSESGRDRKAVKFRFLAG